MENLIKPFRNRIEFIVKRKYNRSNKEYLNIEIKDDINIILPDFDGNEYYSGMEVDKDYSLKELGLYE